MLNAGNARLASEQLATGPVLHFLDICAVDVTKRSDAELSADPRKAALAARLRDLDRPSNRFSYLLALMEKASDTRSTLTDDELKKNVLNDVRHMKSFFVDASVPEPEDFLLDYLGELRRNPVELNRPAYLAFLNAANDRFDLAHPVAKAKRFSTAKDLVAEAVRLGITRQHPLVTVTLACLYGNAGARKVLKFRAKTQTFNSENVLADIMTIGRFLERKLELEKDGRKGLTTIRSVVYVTDDAGLEEVLSCYDGQATSSKEADGHHEVRTNGTVQFARLLTEISHEPGPLLNPADPNSAGPSEYDRVCALVFG